MFYLQDKHAVPYRVTIHPYSFVKKEKKKENNVLSACVTDDNTHTGRAREREE